MTTDSALLLVFLAALAVLFLTGWVAVDVAVLCAVAFLTLCSYLTPQEAFSGFSSPTVITMVAVFFMSAALRETGVADALGRIIGKISGRRERSVVGAVMAVGALFSSCMNNVAATALLMPAVTEIARLRKLAPSRLLMPLAYGVVLGGMTTLIGTPPNMIVSDLMRQRGIAPFQFLDFTIFGVTAALIGIGFVGFFGYRLLPKLEPSGDGLGDPKTPLAEVYRLNERLFQFRVPAGSNLVGQSLGAVKLAAEYGAQVVAIERNSTRQLMPSAADVIRSEDLLIVAGRSEDLQKLPAGALLLESEGGCPDFETSSIGVVEAVITPRSMVLDKSIAEIRFLERYGFQVLALWRDGRPLRSRLGNLRLRLGDGLLLVGPRSRLSMLEREDDFAVISESVKVARNTAKAPWAIGAFVLMVLLTVARIETIEVAALIGALVVLLSGALTIEQAYRSVEWRIITLVAGLISVGLAAEHGGVVTYLARELGSFGAQGSPLAVLLAFGLLSSLLSQALDGPIAVVILAPIAITLCQQLHLAPEPFLMMVALASSVAFMMPMSSKSNLLVMSAGGYSARDFLKVGTPLSILILAVLMVLIPVFLPFWEVATRSFIFLSGRSTVTRVILCP